VLENLLYFPVRGINLDFRGINLDFRGINLDFRGINLDFRGILYLFRGIPALDFLLLLKNDPYIGAQPIKKAPEINLSGAF
jgi:hypothetical protein